ncbi:MAG: sugar phosphate isomerase/epimerase [Planctomycetes bacterium]|nr:sugar phosphate isomerase/epimerase [Planctomycetota bacterium]
MLLASNHMFPTGPIEGVFDRIARAGAGGLDLFPPHIPYLTQGKFGPKNLELCRMAAEAAGLPIRGIIGSPAPGGKGFTAYQDADEKQGRADAVAFIRHNIELAKALGAVHLCTAEGRLPDGADEQAIWDRLVAALKESAEHLEAAGMVLGIELHPGLIASTPEKAPKLIDDVGSKSVRVCLDFCHANVITKGDPVGMIRALKGTMGSIHIADGIQVPGLHLPIGQGEIDVDACIRAVKDGGFDGLWVLCMYGCAFPELTLRTAVEFLKEKHPEILAK